jgi:hypothetical protein
MLALLAMLVCAGDNEQAVCPKPPPPPVVIPIPNGAGAQFRFRLSTDWAPVTHLRPVWRMAQRFDNPDRWEESVSGQSGGRIRERIAESDVGRVFATTGQSAAGSGGVGAGFEACVYVGGSWTAGVDVECTPRGPRLVLALTHYPFEGVTRHYGWSVLSNQLVHARGWHFEEDDLRWLHYRPRFAAMMYLYDLRRWLGLPREE